jgi:hypothetical protein
MERRPAFKEERPREFIELCYAIISWRTIAWKSRRVYALFDLIRQITNESVIVRHEIGRRQRSIIVSTIDDAVLLKLSRKRRRDRCWNRRRETFKESKIDQACNMIHFRKWITSRNGRLHRFHEFDTIFWYSFRLDLLSPIFKTRWVHRRVLSQRLLQFSKMQYICIKREKRMKIWIYSVLGQKRSRSYVINGSASARLIRLRGINSLRVPLFLSRHKSFVHDDR